jgi:elongation factor G
LGVGFFNWQYHHLQEVPDKLADNILTTAEANQVASSK